MATNFKLPQSKTREQLLKELDDRLRLNRGSFTNIASETGSSRPFTVQQGRRVQDPSGLGQQNPQLNFDIPQAPSIPQLSSQPQYQPDQQVDYSASSQEGQQPTTQEFLQQIFNQAWEPQLPTVEQMDARYQETGVAYPIQSLPDGGVRYNDGTIKYKNGEPPIPIASLPDGTVLWDDGFIRERPPEGLSGYLAGVSGLSSLVFGQDQTVTQPYGAYNPSIEPGSGYNLGTDFRTKDLNGSPLLAPIPMRVVQVFQDDGTRWGDISGHQGYGNSVLLELPDGQMIRLSHLSDIGQFQIGDVLNPGDLIGTPGSTGNATGEHLDLEYYNSQGQLDNPSNFRLDTEIYNIGNQIVGVSPQVQPFSQTSQPQVQQPSIQQPQYAGQTINENIVQPAASAIKNTASSLGESTQKAYQQTPTGQLLGTAAKTVESVKPTGDLGIGLTEYAQGKPIEGIKEEARTLEKLSDTIAGPGRLPELYLGEAGRGEKTLGDVAAKTKETLGNVFGAITPKAYASEGLNVDEQSKEGEQRFNTTVQQAGEGLKNIGRLGIDALSNIFQKKPLLGGTGQRVIGEESAGGNQSASFSPKQSVPNDIRDPFFKSGASDQYSQFIRPENIGEGALSLNVFTPEFYQNPENIKNVFGGTFLQEQAQAKYDEYQAEQRRKAEEEARRRAEEEANKPSLQDYLNRGKTAEQWYAETGQQSTLDRIKAQGGDVNQPYSSSQANYSSPSGQSLYIPPPQSPTDKLLKSLGAQTNINYTPANANYTSSTGQALYVPPPKQSAPQQNQSNIFSRAYSAIKNIFSR